MPPVRLLHWLTPEEADTLLAELLGCLDLRSYQIQMFGRQVDEPRLIDWRGEQPYIYSRRVLEPRPFERVTEHLRARVSEAGGVAFNHMLANYYRTGQDYMGWHRDNEPELGPRPVVASLSLGAPRDFRFRRRDNKADTQTVELVSGSLLIMQAGCQETYEHCLPKRTRVQQPRLNLTFRAVHPPS